MMRSMTSFARRDARGKWGLVTCEIRTVNHRYLEPSFRLPDNLRELESGYRDQLRSILRRGKVDVALHFQPTETRPSLDIDESMARAVSQAARRINGLLDDPAPISALDILRWPGVLASSEQDYSSVKQAAQMLFADTVVELVAVREREGERLRPLFDQRLTTIGALVAEVRGLMPILLAFQEATLKDRFERARVELEPDRLAQELVMLAQKSDVSEELDRLDAHIQEVTHVLGSNDAIGRKLDFLMQELNREANTLGSKSIDARVTRASIDLKVLIEQMREQVQNVE